MAFGARATRKEIGEVEILLKPVGEDSKESIVLDATTVAADASGRRVLRRGTILIADSTTKKHKKYTAAVGEVIVGILDRTIEFFDGTSRSNKPTAMIIHMAVFDQDMIVDFNTHEAALRAALPTCRFLTKP